MADRLQQEIDDLLAKLDTFPPKRSFRSRFSRNLKNAWGNLTGAISDIPRPNLSAGHVLLIAIGVVVIAYLFLPSGSDTTRWIIAAGVIVFIFAFVMSLRRHSRPPEKYWRDKPIDLRGGGGPRSWWNRRRRR
jgi:hypothetical protein